MHILLLEPDRVLAGVYRQAFESTGHSVVMCASAQSAIFAADLRRPDVVVMELQLIEHSGIEFLYEFRSYPEWQAVPVVIHSGIPPIEFANSRNLLTNELLVGQYHYKPQTTLRQLLQSIGKTAAPKSLSV